MALDPDRRPEWLTFDCYGTLIQWDEGLQRVAADVSAKRGGNIDLAKLVQAYDQREGELERNAPFKEFRVVAGKAFPAALKDLGVNANETDDGKALVEAIPTFGPFPETLDTLAALKAARFKIAIISNSDDDIIAGNVAQLGGLVDQVVTAQQARAYKPSRLIFDHALTKLGVGYDRLLHICASPALDHAAARDQQFRCVWINRGTYRKPLADYEPDQTFRTLTGLTDLFPKLGWMNVS